MLDVLSVFERLSKNMTLNQESVLDVLKSLPVSVITAFKNKDSKALRNFYADKKCFSDGIMAFRNCYADKKCFSEGIFVFNNTL